jgi:hypothetical protein
MLRLEVVGVNAMLRHLEATRAGLAMESLAEEPETAATTKAEDE